jgi:hypothetical protein
LNTVSHAHSAGNYFNGLRNGLTAKEGSRCGRSQRRTVEGEEMRTFGEKDGCAYEARGTRFRDGLGMWAEFW